MIFWGAVDSYGSCEPQDVSLGLRCREAIQEFGLTVAKRTSMRGALHSCGHGVGGVMSKTDDAVIAINMHNFGLISCGFCVVHLRIGDEDDEIAGVDQVRGRTIDAKYSRIALAGDRVGFQACSVGNVHD